MSVWWLLLAIVAGLVLIAGIVAGAVIWAARRSPKPVPGNSGGEAFPERRHATVKAKEIREAPGPGTQNPYLMASPALEYRVLFALEGGGVCWTAVEERCYGDFQIGESGELLTQGGRFLDFAGRYGKGM